MSDRFSPRSAGSGGYGLTPRPGDAEALPLRSPPPFLDCTGTPAFLPAISYHVGTFQNIGPSAHSCWAFRHVSPGTDLSARRMGPARSIGDQIVTQSINRWLRPIAQVQLLQEIRHVIFDRLLADDERVGDLLVGLAVHDQFQDLKFPRR